MPDAPNPKPQKFSLEPQKFSRVLGLPVDDEQTAPQGMAEVEQPDGAREVQLSVIVPARNEEHNLPACLATLLAQSDEFFLLSRDWELIVVDDASTDSTYALAKEIAAQHPGLQVMQAPLLEMGERERAFTGKTQACWTGAQRSQGRWLLFTDADTLHEPGNLLRALHEAQRHAVVMLSYSPRQIISGLAQATLMPLVFSELASVYPPAQINDPGRRIAAANGQFLLVERDAYFAVGGHRMVGRSVLEDVDLAYNLKRAFTKHGGQGIRLRYAPDALSTRMYVGFGDMVEGWSKNLALLFPHALALAAWRLLDILLLLLPLLLVFVPSLGDVAWKPVAILLLWARNLWRFYARVARSNFSAVDCALSPLALPLFVYLLLRSWANHRLLHQVAWKGREYSVKR